MPETPVWRIDLERGRRPSLTDETPELYDSASFPSSPDGSSLGFIDQGNNLYAAVPDRQEGWKVWLAQGQQWVETNRKEIITGVKVIANSLVLAGSTVEAYGPASAQTGGLAAKTTGSVLNTLTQGWDVYNNVSSARQTYAEDGLNSGVVQDSVRAVAQGVALGGGVTNAFAPWVGKAAGLVQQGTAIASLATTGPTSQETKEARKKKGQTFTQHRNDHIDVAEPAAGQPRPRHGGQGRPADADVTFRPVNYEDSRRPRARRQDTEVDPSAYSTSSAAARYTPTSAAQNADTSYFAAQGQGQGRGRGQDSPSQADTSGLARQGDVRRPVRRQTTWTETPSSSSSSRSRK
ncbi:hypothetical protein ACFVT5_19365 [Streptomyces sp. NPDC058001]|uniref:hypothetical protein n=1 Tax=Streptomyces sp. NPDC058001 TaxID=3346300 RepID=UPI0036E922FA